MIIDSSLPVVSFQAIVTLSKWINKNEFDHMGIIIRNAEVSEWA